MAGIPSCATIVANDAKASQRGAVLLVEPGRKVRWPGIAIKPPEGRWNLSAFTYVAMDIKNVGQHRVVVHCRVDNPGADGVRNCTVQSAEVPPGGKDTVCVLLTRKPSEPFRSLLFGMRGLPGGMCERNCIDPTNVVELRIFVGKSKEDCRFEIRNVRAGGAAEKELPKEESRLFPLIDQFGQYTHKDWPGKIESLEDLRDRKTEEQADLSAHPAPADWDQYGGWRTGPQLRATGFFRVEKYRAKWWLVDPEGRLFWSHGIDCVGKHAVTPITDRKHWFVDLPQAGSPLAKFYGKGNWAPHNYYEGKRFETYDFSAANLLRKYGDKWRTEAARLAPRRLRSWGMNTIGNWASAEVCALHQIPYVATLGVHSTTLAGGEGYWRKFPDVFDPRFAATAQMQSIAQRDRSAGDPWCIGYFVDNEESWGDETSLAAATLRSPPEQAAKRVFVDDLKKKYQTIKRLNAVWDTRHASWEALLQSTDPPNKSKAHDDLAAFYTKTAERYFEVCRDAVKAVAPSQLYLGCRFAGTNPRAMRAAAKYCDVVSFNRYTHVVDNLRLPEDVDKPMIIGEFHFGALDRGMFHPGLVPTLNQRERALAYMKYVHSAWENSAIVGAHWFQYGDQPTTGRGDGENYQIGFLDVCDTPYSETIQAARELGRRMYTTRSGSR